jgi:putative phosphoesterase
MLIGIISDIHDHLPNLRTALERLRAEGAETLICCGDLCSPFVITELAQGFPNGTTHVVFGNNDGDRFRCNIFAHRQKGAGGAVRVEVHGESIALDLAGKRIFVHHFNDVGALIAAGGQFDAVCYGHNHEWKARRHPGGTLEINPGAIMGWHPRNGDIPATYAVYDTEKDEVRVYENATGEVISTVT